MTGRLEATFARLRAKREKALIAYLMAGDPGLPETEQLVVALEQAGADIIELGVPFSDPIADGPENSDVNQVAQATYGDSDRPYALLQLDSCDGVSGVLHCGKHRWCGWLDRAGYAAG
jgi:tryptophan synthase alpha subunit